MRSSCVLGEKSHPVLRPAPGACPPAVVASIHGLRLPLPVPFHAGRCGRLYPSSCFCLSLFSFLSDEEPFLPALLWCGCQVTPRLAGPGPLAFTPSDAVGQPAADPQRPAASARRPTSSAIAAAASQEPPFPSRSIFGSASHLMISIRKTLDQTDEALRTTGPLTPKNGLLISSIQG